MEGRNPDPVILQMLLDAGADPNVPAYGDSDTWAGWTPFLVMADKLPLVQMFLDAGADLTEVTTWLQREQMFLDAGADPFVRSPEGATVLHVALWTRTSPAPVRFFLDLGVPPDLPNKYGYTPLLAACFTEHLDLTTFRYLLDAGTNPNVRDERGRTPLDIVTGRGDEAIAQLLRNATGAQNDSPATPPEEGEGVTRLTCATCCQEAYRDEANCQSMLPFCNCAPSEPPDDSEDDGFMDPLCCTDWGREQDFAFCEDVQCPPREDPPDAPLAPYLGTWTLWTTITENCSSSDGSGSIHVRRNGSLSGWFHNDKTVRTRRDTYRNNVRYTLSGTLSPAGYVEGTFHFEERYTGSLSGSLYESGTGSGTWRDTADCVGIWRATKQ